MAFVHLFCQSHHSAKGVASPVDLVRRARGLGCSTLGLCDEGTLAGFLDFDDACRAQSLRPVFGCRIMIEGFALTGMTFPVDFLIETEQGYRNLVRMLTRYHDQGRGERHPLKAADLLERTQGLISVVPVDGELARLVEMRDRDNTEKYLREAVKIFGQGLAFGVSIQPEHIGLTQWACRLGRFMGLRCLAAPLVHYPEPGDSAAAFFLSHPRQAPGRSFRPPETLKDHTALMSEAEVLERWAEVDEELAHESGNVARRCTWRPGRIRRAFPAMDLERGFDPNSYLFDLVIRGATQRYQEITEAIKQRINREYEDVKANKLASYLLLNHQISHALDERGISRGVGRGRLVSSVLAYCLGISRIDPLQYNLLAQSLKNDVEVSPLIHIEVPRNGMPVILDWLRETYGDDHLVEVGRIQDTRRDQMINELAAWAGMTDEERRLAHREKARLRSAGAAQRLDELAGGTRERRWRDPAFLGDLAARLSPRPRQWVGSGDRFALSGEPLEWIVPLMQSSQQRPVSGLSEEAIDRLGLARLVFVPHHLLDTLDQAMRTARTLDPGLDFRNIPLDDRATYDLLSRGMTSGIPPLEGISLRCLLARQKPSNLLQLLKVKTEAGQRREGDRPRQWGDELPDVLLSYQCAFLKANYPLAFYGAAIGSRVEQRGNPASLIREARRGGFDIKPPHINLSDWGTTIHNGLIRLGLSTVRNFGQRAWENVLSVRSGGAFTNLENFCERIDTRIINLRILRSLIASGAMDELGDSRAAMDAMVQRLQKQARERSGSRASEGGQATLFELDEWVETESESADMPSEPIDVQAWSREETLRRESEALGFYLSEDPLHAYRIILGHLDPIHIDAVSLKLKGRYVRVTGLVCATEKDGPLIENEGDLMMDLEGVPVVIPREIAEGSGFCLEPADAVLIHGRFSRDKGYLALQAEGLWRLTDLDNQAVQVRAIALNLAGENRQTLKLLMGLFKEYPGESEIRLADYPERQGWLYRRLARRRVCFCSPFFQGLCKILSPDSIQLFGAGDEPLVVRAAMPEEDEETETPQLVS